MCQLALINDVSYISNAWEIGDIPAAKEDDYIPTGTELRKFEWVKVKNYTVKEFWLHLRPKVPEKKLVYRSSGIWTDIPPEEKEVWKDPADGQWKTLENPHRTSPFTARFLTEEDKENLGKGGEFTETALAKIVHTHAIYAENLIVEKDLN